MLGIGALLLFIRYCYTLPESLPMSFNCFPIFIDIWTNFDPEAMQDHCRKGFEELRGETQGARETAWDLGNSASKIGGFELATHR